MPSEFDKMLAGELYRPDDPQIQTHSADTARWLARYNAAAARDAEVRRRILRERLAEVGDGAEIRPPFFCDYGTNIRLGRGAFLNFNCVILDVVDVTIGDGTQIGPAVQIYAADHPRDSAVRLAQRRIQPAHVIAWSLWRRAHQAAARRSHLKQRMQL